jgi:beta-lactamase class D
MKKHIISISISFFLFLNIMPARGNDQVGVIERLFQSENVNGTFLVSSMNGEMRKTFNFQRSKTRFSPASTYKILNTLIGLKYGAVSSGDFSFQWDGVERGVPAWSKDQSLASAFKISCVWCYQEIANEVGVSKYSHELDATSYGNQCVSAPVDLHWLNGVLKISANEQVDFLKRLVNRTLPYDHRHTNILKEIMFVERNPNYTLYAKSGWTGPKLAVGWYVGYIETESDTFVFAMNMAMNDIKQAPLRKKLVIQSLQALKLI